MRRFLFLVIFAPAVASSWRAAANPRPLPYTYPSESLPGGSLEIEQYVDLTPVPAVAASGTVSNASGLTTLIESTLTTEVEYGITSALELGLYFQLSDNPGTATGESQTVPIGFDGVKQRLRYRLARPGEWPIDVALYGEIAELQNEIELEAKLNLQRRFGPVRLMVNLWAEREFYFTGRQEWVLNPTGGVAWEVFPWLSLGVEYWMHAELGGGASTAVNTFSAFNEAPHHYLGPAIMLQFHKLWWSVAPYARLDEWSRAPQQGDQYGRLWVRTVLGLDL
jgi:hypothetical protein